MQEFINDKIISEENVYLNNSLFADNIREELQELNKHDIIARIAEKLGENPSTLKMSEEIFNDIKYNIANYVIHHEYGRDQGICADLLLWLDSKIYPERVKKLNKFISRFCKNIE